LWVSLSLIIGYAPNPKTFKRNHIATPFQEEAPKFHSEQVRVKRGQPPISQVFFQFMLKKKGFELTNSVSISSGIPNYYKQIEIQYSKFGV
jgi:hypothetical protein